MAAHTPSKDTPPLAPVELELAAEELGEHAEPASARSR